MADTKQPPPLTDAECAILDSFDYHKPSEEQTERIQLLRFGYKAVALQVIRCVAASADRTAALRQLHESQMTALKGIVCEPGTPKAG